MSAFVLAVAPLVAASSNSKSTTSSPLPFLIIIVLFGGLAMLWARSQKQKARRQSQTHASIGIGDEIMTIGGIIGTVIEIDPDRVTIISGAKSAPSDPVPTQIVLMRQAIARKIDPEPSLPSGPEGAELANGFAYKSDDDDQKADNDPTMKDGSGKVAGYEATEGKEEQGLS